MVSHINSVKARKVCIIGTLLQQEVKGSSPRAIEKTHVKLLGCIFWRPSAFMLSIQLMWNLLNFLTTLFQVIYPYF